MTRAQRKLDHIHYAIATGQSRSSGFDEIKLVHQSLPNTALQNISIQTKIGELNLSSPIFINAMTGGGGRETEKINEQLAIVAKETGVSMAVGSQMAALKSKEERGTFEIVRKVNPNGLVFANLGSEATPEQAKQAVEMIEANALQIHLNVIQELTMPEGDRDFQGVLERIQAICEEITVPVIVKETGFGMSYESVKKLSSLSLGAVDIGGFGGTNFAAIENERRKKALSYFNNWGIPTAASIIEAAHAANQLDIIASGGIQDSLDIVKSFALGAKAAGLAGYLLKILLDEGLHAVIEEVQTIHGDIKMIMCALGAEKIADLDKVAVVFTGELYQWLQARGLEPDHFSRRSC